MCRFAEKMTLSASRLPRLPVNRAATTVRLKSSLSESARKSDEMTRAPAAAVKSIKSAAVATSSSFSLMKRKRTKKKIPFYNCKLIIALPSYSLAALRRISGYCFNEKKKSRKENTFLQLSIDIALPPYSLAALRRIRGIAFESVIPVLPIKERF